MTRLNEYGDLVDYELFYCPVCDEIVRGIVHPGKELKATCPFSGTLLTKPPARLNPPRLTHDREDAEAMFKRYDRLIKELRAGDPSAGATVGYDEVAELLGETSAYQAALKARRRA